MDALFRRALGGAPHPPHPPPPGCPMLGTAEPQGLLASIRYFEACRWGKAGSAREQLGKSEEGACPLSAGSWEGFLEEAA